MQFHIRHLTRYRYSKPVTLSPQLLRFFPRVDGSQTVQSCALTVDPLPDVYNEYLDLSGNRVAQVWFEQPTDRFDISLDIQVETLRKNPFDFILTPGAERCPIDYGEDAQAAAQYLRTEIRAVAVERYAAKVLNSVNGDSVAYIRALGEKINKEIAHIYRKSGGPQSPAETLERRSGACRDIAVLFISCCRLQGIAARFVSGYHDLSAQAADQRYLHAWPEVYLPGAGWRGFDPTRNLMIGDTHVSVAAAAFSRDTMPVTGGYFGKQAQSTLDYNVEITVS